MPKLTADNLEELARKAREHRLDSPGPPATPEEALERRKRSHERRVREGRLDRPVYAWTLGPTDCYLVTSEYHAMCGVSVADTVTGGWGGLPRGLITIEEQLRKRLAELPPEKGFDIVVVFHEREGSCASESWDAGAEVDEDLRACLARARATPQHYHEKGLAADEALDNALRDAAYSNSRPSPGATECLECGATYDLPGHVEDGGMGCDRCNSVGAR